MWSHPRQSFSTSALLLLPTCLLLSAAPAAGCGVLLSSQVPAMRCGCFCAVTSARCLLSELLYLSMIACCSVLLQYVMPWVHNFPLNSLTLLSITAITVNDSNVMFVFMLRSRVSASHSVLPPSFYINVTKKTLF